MTSRAVDGACAFAWRVYLLRHQGVDETDDRRAALRRYIATLSAAGEHDFDVLQVAAVVYLNKLDEGCQDEEARQAASEAVARRLSEADQ